MTQALFLAALGTGFTCLMTALGACVVFLFRRQSSPGLHRVMLGFAAGVMLAASVWSLLIPSIEKARELHLAGWLPAAGGRHWASPFCWPWMPCCPIWPRSPSTGGRARPPAAGP